jgi:hypothetical protein
MPLPDGLVALQVVELLQSTKVAGFDANLTVVNTCDWGGAKPSPVITTLVPPDSRPLFGRMLLMTGTNVNRSAELVKLVVLFSETVTSTVCVPGGLIAVHRVELVQFTPVAAFGPKLIVVAPGWVLKFVPKIFTVVPPVAGPIAGEMLLTTGNGA